jgi:hypothetical protein
MFVFFCSSVAEPGCFIPDPKIFPSRIPDLDPDLNIFHPGYYIKKRAET